MLVRVSRAANSHVEFDGVLKALAEALRPLPPEDVVAVVTVDGDTLRRNGNVEDRTRRRQPTLDPLRSGG